MSAPSPVKMHPIERSELPEEAAAYFDYCAAGFRGLGFHSSGITRSDFDSSMFASRNFNVFYSETSGLTLAFGIYSIVRRRGLLASLLPFLYRSEHRKSRMLQSFFADGYRFVTSDSDYIAKSLGSRVIPRAGYHFVDSSEELSRMVAGHIARRKQVESERSTTAVPVSTIEDYESFPSRYGEKVSSP